MRLRFQKKLVADKTAAVTGKIRGSRTDDPLPTENKPPSPTGVTDEIIEQEIQAHWTARMMRPVRRLYEWVLHWAETRYAGVALAVTAFSEAVWFPIPVDPLLVALCLGKPKRSFWYAVSCTFWSTFGAMFAMLAGAWLGEERVVGAMAWLDHQMGWFSLNLEENARWVLDLFRKYDFWAVALGAILPIPYKVFAWIAGFAEVNWLTFLVATVIFRKLRYMLIGVLIYFYGIRAKQFIDKYFNWVVLGTGILLLLAILGIKCLGQLIGG
jgi:membrane protein YqaA with SNARE-associated domain